MTYPSRSHLASTAGTARRSSGHAATLECGVVLEYESAEFLPSPGELVPCRRHGYCLTEAVRRTGGWTQRHHPPARGREQEELVDWLWDHPQTTVHALRRQRFTLRMVVAAERAGLLSVDLPSGRVVARPVHQQASWQHLPRTPLSTSAANREAPE